MIVSPFSPIFFLGARKTDGTECPYVQIFSRADDVALQVIRASDETKKVPVVVDAISGTQNNAFMSDTYSFGAQRIDHFHFNANDAQLANGYYYVRIGDEESEVFHITDNAYALKDSVLVEYCYGTNRRRLDVLGINGGTRLYFSFRIPGGFKDGGRAYSVDNEQFVTQTADIIEIYSIESIQQTLTIGSNEGAPIWFGDLLNRLLTCKYVYIDKQRYVRYQSSVPEFEQPLATVNSFIFTQKLQKINHIEPTKI